MNMDKTDDRIHQRVTDLLTQEMGIDVPAPDTDLMENGYLDSLLFVKMLALLEEKFDIRVSMEELEFEYFKTAKGITAFVKQKLETMKPNR